MSILLHNHVRYENWSTYLCTNEAAPVEFLFLSTCSIHNVEFSKYAIARGLNTLNIWNFRTQTVLRCKHLFTSCPPFSLKFFAYLVLSGPKHIRSHIEFCRLETFWQYKLNFYIWRVANYSVCHGCSESKTTQSHNLSPHSTPVFSTTPCS